MTYTLTISTAYWTEEDIAHGANDPELTISRDYEFDSLGELARELVDNGFSEPSSSPWEQNVSNVWLSDESYDNPQTKYIENKTASFGGDMTTEQKTAVLNYVLNEWDSNYGDNDSAERAITYMLEEKNVRMDESDYTDAYMGEYDSFADYVKSYYEDNNRAFREMPEEITRFIDWPALAADRESDYHIIECPYGGVWVFIA